MQPEEFHSLSSGKYTVFRTEVCAALNIWSFHTNIDVNRIGELKRNLYVISHIS